MEAGQSIILTIAIVGVIGIVVAASVAWLAGGKRAVARYKARTAQEHAAISKAAEAEAEEVLESARKAAQLDAKELRAETRAALDAERTEQLSALTKQQGELAQQQQALASAQTAAAQEKEKLNADRQHIAAQEQAVAAQRAEYTEKLQSITGQSVQALKTELEATIQQQAQAQLQTLKAQVLGEGEEHFKHEARRILLDSMQRIAVEATSEATSTEVRLPGEEFKGRLIGREGRNIQSFEAVTGTTLVIDETPKTVFVSSFDPVRREIASRALQRLIKDGRIHPATIEEATVEARGRIEERIQELGEDAAASLGVRGLTAEVLHLLGKLHFYLSNNQRTLAHSVEVAKLATAFAEELGLDKNTAARVGLLHDIGKALPTEEGASHDVAGARFLQEQGESETVCQAIEGSHEGTQANNLYTVLLQLSDTVSSTRPGARSENMDGYMRRIKDLEELALSFEGVKDTYALRAGREIRIVVQPGEVNDDAARSLALAVREKIENTLTYPGTLKVTVVRETRFEESATGQAE